LFPTSAQAARSPFLSKAALENYRAHFNRVFNEGSDGLYRKGVNFKLHRAADGYTWVGTHQAEPSARKMRKGMEDMMKQQPPSAAADWVALLE
jgi:hypothetical protein